MERDFMGLKSKEPLTVKQEAITDSSKQRGFARAPGMQWPFFNEVSAVPHVMPFKVNQVDQSKRVDPMLSYGFMSVSAADKSSNNEKQVETHLTMSAYPLQHDILSGYRYPKTKILSTANHSVSNSMSNPLFKNEHATTTQNMVANIVKPQLLRGFPIAASQAVPPAVTSAGATNSCSEGSAAPAQLTIFYEGTVNVFEAISPEKAQAIMFFAGSSVPMSSNMGQPYAQVLAPNSMQPAVDFPPVNQPTTPPRCSRLSGTLSVSLHNDAQSRSGSTSTQEPIDRTKGVKTTSASMLEPATITSSPGTVSATAMIQTASLIAVPQARKASLARFLEKRKERVRNTAPYNLNKNCLELFAASSKE